MEKFKKKNLLEKRKMVIEELIVYETELRKYNFQKGDKLKGIELRKKIHGLVNIILKIDQILSKEKIIILNDLSNKNTNKPKIFACTHIGGNDIQRTFQIIEKPAYLMLGDPGILYKKMIYQALRMNGVIPLETTDKIDRRNAYSRSVELLQNGGNLLIYPEGAWNVSPNVLVMKTFTGTVRLAQETGAEIIPIAVEQYNNDFYFNIGENYFIPKECSKSSDELNKDLRDKLATLKWEILLSQEKLEYLNKPNLNAFQDEIIARCNYGYGFSLQDALNEAFHDKNVIEEKEVYKFLENMEINKKNCILLKKKIEMQNK